MKINNPIFPIVALLMSCSTITFGVSEVSPKSSMKYLNKSSNEVIFVDLRSKEDYEISHIPGALHIDYFSPNYEVELLNIPKDKIIVLYCKHGLRSKNAAKLLKTRGFRRAYSLKGGFIEWEKSGLPVERSKK